MIQPKRHSSEKEIQCVERFRMSLFEKLSGLRLSGKPATHKSGRDADNVPNTPNTALSLSIDCPDPTDEDRAGDRFRHRGQHLARQERWSALSAEIALADEARDRTPNGTPAAELLAYGARSDVVLAAEHALLGGKPDKGAPVLAGIEALEEILGRAQDDAMTGTLVAMAHMDLGWAWRGTGPVKKVAPRNLEAFEAHFDRAYDILVHFAAEGKDSPFFMAARCALNAAGLSQHSQISRDFERLIDLNPMNPSAMRALGTYMSPRWFGSLADLELEARRTAARTHREWGAGAYSWVMMDALPGDEKALANLDVTFFVEGLDDIVHRMPDQHTINLIAAFCAHMGAHAYSGDDTADRTATMIANCAQWVVRNHMTELHPLIWAHAAAGFANNVHVPSPRRFAAMGRQDGLRFIADLFHREIAQGRRIVFTEDGPVAEHS